VAFTIGSIFAIFRVRDGDLRRVTLTAFSFVAGRTLLFAVIGNVETRHT